MKGSNEYQTLVKYKTKPGLTNNFPLTFEVPEGSYLQVLVGFRLTEEGKDYTVQRINSQETVVFKEDLKEGVTVTLRRVSSAGTVPHHFQYTGNVQGGAEFSAKSVDENFEYLNQIVLEIEEGSLNSQDDLASVGEDFEETQRIAIEASKSAKEASRDSQHAVEIAEGIDSKAQEALDTSRESLDVAEGIEGKADLAIQISSEAKAEAGTAKDIAEEALEATVGGVVEDSYGTASNRAYSQRYVNLELERVDTDLESKRDKDDWVFRFLESQHFRVFDYDEDGKPWGISVRSFAHTKKGIATHYGDIEYYLALPHRRSGTLALDEDLKEKRDLDDTEFHSPLQLHAEDDIGTGVFMFCPEGKVRGQMAFNNYGLQFTQVQEDGTAQTFTFPRYGEGGEIALTSSQLGVGQKWVDVGSQRRVGVIYTNNTPAPIVVSVTARADAGEDWKSANPYIRIEVGGVRGGANKVAGSDAYSHVSAVVPPGETYAVKEGSGPNDAFGFDVWVELR